MSPQETTMHHGGCACGAVRYEIVGELGRTYFCHCSRCRKTSGSAFTANAVIAPAQLRLLRGVDALSVYRTEAGADRSFCRACGSHLFVSQGEQMRLRLGSLDTPLGGPLDMHIFTGSKADWIDLHDDLPKHEERP